MQSKEKYMGGNGNAQTEMNAIINIAYLRDMLW